METGNAKDQETYHFGMGCLQQGRHHEKPQSKHADQEKSVQKWVCAAGYDIWKWNLGFNHRPNGGTCSGTKENGENYAGHHPSRPETSHLDPAADRSDRRHRPHQTVETPMGRSCSQTSRQQVDHQSNILGSTEMVKTTRKTKNKMERLPQLAPGNHLDKIGPRQTSVEAIQGGVPP